MVSESLWTQLRAIVPPKLAENEPRAIEFKGKHVFDGGDERSIKVTWHGTILPKSDGDIWLAAAFAEYEKFASHEHRRVDAGREMFGTRTNYLYGVMNYKDVPLTEIVSLPDHAHWYRIANCKGQMLLHELHATLGDKIFGDAMESFGTQHAGQEVTTADFVAHVEKAAGKSLKPFFDYWLTKTGLPRLKLGEIKVSRDVSSTPDKTKPFVIEGSINTDGAPLPISIDISIETAKGEFLKTAPLDAATGKLQNRIDRKANSADGR